MKRTNRHLAWSMIVVLLVSGAALLAGSASGQTPNVPVDFESSGLSPAQLHFWRQGSSGCDINSTDAGDDAPTTPAPLCQMRIQPPEVDASSDARSETRFIRGEAPGAAGQTINDSSVVRFTLDTFTSEEDSGPGATAQPARFPFTIQAGSSALQIQFYYDSESVCEEELEGPQPIDFHIRFRKGTPQEPLINDPFATTVETVCGTPGGDLDSGNANQVTASIRLDEPVTVQQGEVLVTEIFAVSQEVEDSGPGGLRWAIFFQDDSFDSRVSVRTPQAVEKAVWTTDKTGSVRNTFNPDASDSERFLVPRMALRSPFGNEAIPADGFRSEIIGPDGAAEDLVTDRPGDQFDLAMAEQRNLRDRQGALKIYKIRQPSGSEQPWHYPEGVMSGSYTVRVNGEIVTDQPVSFTKNVAMGAFDFRLGPVDEESTNHQLRRGSSTTFLLELENRATRSDTFEVDASFQFSEGGTTWGVDLSGVDQNDRVTIDPQRKALLQVRVTPPEGASVGDRARVLVQATSSASGATENTTLEAQITDQTIRDVNLLVLRDQPIPVGLDETSEFTVFAWNQGTATDSLSASVVANSSQTDKPEAFEAALGQQEFSSIAPGSVANVPVEVTTTSEAREDDTFSFEIRTQSQANPAAAASQRVETVVQAERGISLLGIDHQNGEALESLRWARFNRTNEAPNPPFECPFDNEREQRECGDFANWTYHRVMIENTGDQPETVTLSALPAEGITVGEETMPGRTTQSPNDCTPILDGRLKPAQTGFVRSINHDDPGEAPLEDTLEVQPGDTEVAYFRVAYDGETVYYEDTLDACDTEAYHATVVASIATGQEQTINTHTRFPFANTGDMPSGAQGRLALEDRHVRNGRMVELPRFVGIDPGNETTVNFTLSLQSGHEDQANVTIVSDNLVGDLEAEGWDIRLVSLDAPADRFGPHTIRVPSSSLLGPRADDSIGHATGVDYKLGLELTPPASGLQENERFQFAVQANSEQRIAETDSVSLGVQIGQDFAFGLQPGNRTIDAHPGDEVAFSLGVQNEGATRDDYEITTNGSGAEVSAQPSAFAVSAGSRQVSAIHAQIPSGAESNQQVSVGASVTAARGTPGDDADDLGPRSVDYTVNVRPPSTLTMDASEPIVSVSPGGETALNFSITNQKDTPQNLEITQVIGPPDWDTSLTNTNVTRRIDGGETITQTVLIEAPETIVEGSRFPFVVEAQNATDPDEFAVALAEATVQGQTALALEVEGNRTQVVDRGDTTSFPVLVRNPGTSPTDYRLSTSFESQGWSARFVDAETDNVLGNQTVQVPERSFERVVVEVQAPEQVAEGHIEQVTVTAFAEGQRSVSDDVLLNAAIHDYGVEIDVTGASAKDVAPGDDVPFQVSITNTGNGEDQISLSFAGPESEEPLYAATSELSEGTTPILEAGETLRNVTVDVHVPAARPGEAPIPSADGVTTIIQASSTGVQGGEAPTATAEVTTRLVPFVVNDVDDDTALEVALDLNRDASDGYEVFRDQDAQLIDRDLLNSTQSVSSSGLYVLDGDDDDRMEHLVDTDNDGVGDVYFDPDRARTFQLSFTVDVNDDGQSEHPIDANFDGLVDGMYDPAADETRKTVERDFSGDGRRELLVDANGDLAFDTYVDPNEQPPLVTPVEKTGNLYKIDTQGDGRVDTHYNAQTQSIEDAESANLSSFLGDYWYVVVVFLAVVVAFGVIFYRRL